MAIRNFRRNFAGKSTFPCRVCKRLTRDVGDNGSVELCNECYELAGLENTLSDADDKESVVNWYTAEVLRHLNVLKSRGVDVTTVWGDLMHDFNVAVNVADQKVRALKM